MSPLYTGGISNDAAGLGSDLLSGGISDALGGVLGPLGGLLGSLFGGGGSSASTSQTSNVIANPSVAQGALSNSVVLGPQIGGTGGSAASSGGLFGLFGGGAKGGSGGSNSAYVDQHNTTDLTSNLPAPLQMPGMPNLLSGSGLASQVQTPNGPTFNSVQNNGNGIMDQILASMPRPTAAGGILPTIEQPLNQPGGDGGQQVFNGSAQQSGGYQSPPSPQVPSGAPQQQAPQGMSMQQRLAGAANPMVMALPGQPPPPNTKNGLVQAPRAYDASGALGQYPLQGQAGQLDNSGTPIHGGAGDQVNPDDSLDQSFDDYKNQAAALGEAAKPIIGRVRTQLTQNRLNKEATYGPKKTRAELARDDAKKKLDDLEKAVMDDRDPMKYSTRHGKTWNEMLKQLPEALSQSIHRAIEGQNGQRGSAHPIASAFWHAVEPPRLAAYEAGTRKIQAEANKQTRSEDMENLKAFNQSVANAMANMQKDYAPQLTIAKDEFDKASADVNSLDKEQRIAEHQGAREIINNAKLDLQDLTVQRMANKDAASIYGQGVQKNINKVNANSGTRNAASRAVSAGASAKNASTAVKRENREQDYAPTRKGVGESTINKNNAVATSFGTPEGGLTDDKIISNLVAHGMPKAVAEKTVHWMKVGK